MISSLVSRISGACTVKDFIKGAVLATDAAELLGGRTPTLTLAAIALKHEYEARAECAFVGVGYHFDVDGRIAEIGTQLRAVCQWFSRKNRRFSALDATVVITNRLGQCGFLAGIAALAEAEPEKLGKGHSTRIERVRQGSAGGGGEVVGFVVDVGSVKNGAPGQKNEAHQKR